jgi:hypothetical protein
MVAALLILGVGCDDPEVEEKVADVLQYGAVSAEVTCQNMMMSLCSTTIPTNIYAHRLLDGSTHIRVNTRGGYPSEASAFIPRNQPLYVLARDSGGNTIEYTIEGEEFTLDVACSHPTIPLTETIVMNSTYFPCTGRNLEAFGITP